ncbi:MAG: WYL domain-containing protein [Oscillospiraceae bacterium]
MAGLSKQKQKLLTMRQIFWEKTDEAHALTGKQLIDLLAAEGISAERKTIYDDIATLADSGMDIVTVKEGHANRYYLADRTFQEEELYVLADAVASSKFLTQKKSTELIRKLQTLTNVYKAPKLRRTVYVANRVKSFNESIYYYISTIHDAIASKNDIEFQYYEYNINKKRQLKHRGEVYRVSPYYLIWQNDNYYLICYCPKHDSITHYRIDRMNNVAMVDATRRTLTLGEAELARRMRATYEMYSGESIPLIMEFDKSLMNVVVDRFGESVFTGRKTESTFTVHVDVQISPTFWGWLFTFGKHARVIAPVFAVELAKKRLTEIMESYERQ